MGELVKQQFLIERCEARESGGYQCECYVTHQGQEHDHWISDETIFKGMRRPFGVFITARGVTEVYR